MNMRLFLATWNLGGACPSPDHLEAWLSGAQDCALVAVSVQECQHTASAWPLPFPQRYHTRLCDHLAPTHALVACEKLGTTLLHCFAQRAPEGVGTARVPLGPLGACNKGAAAAQLTVGSARLRFVGAHLTSDEGRAARRNADYHTVEGALGQLLGPCTHAFWLGDLNYRLRAPASTDSCDELLQEMQAGAAFGGYREAPITFGPTYKVAPDLSYDPTRIPSWTDRILFRVPARPRVDFYRAVYGLRLSDHRPVVLRLTT
jgi:hypothetical protein